MATGVAVRALLVSLAVLAVAPGVAVAAPTAPVVFDQTPPAFTNQTSATFTFHDPNGPASFTCALDAATPAPAPPHTR